MVVQTDDRRAAETVQIDEARLHAFLGRAVGDVGALGSAPLVLIGEQLGLYDALAEGGPMTSAELARRTATVERYVREWLQNQAAGGYVEYDAATGRYSLPIEHAAALPNLYGAFQLILAATKAAPRIAEAFRTGAGISYADYGTHFRHGIAGFNRPMFEHLLAAEWLPALPGVDQRLHRPGARVLDLGCGTGHSSIALARAYPTVTVRGVDLDEASIAEARRHAADAGVADRVTFALGDAAATHDAGPYDLITIFEALHDMADPVGVLTSARAVLAPGGSVFIGDERVADTFTAPAGEIERLQYAFSVLHCLPATRAEGDQVANGTILRAPTLVAWAREAGFTEPEVLDLDNDFWRFYLLRN